MKKTLSVFAGAYGYVYRGIFASLVLIFALNIYSFGLTKAGFVFADEESATDTIQSIISTSTINNLTSDDSIATTSIVGDSIGDAFSGIDIQVSSESSSTPTSTDSISSENISTSTDISSSTPNETDSVSTTTSTFTLSTSTTSDISTSTESISASDEMNATSTGDSEISSSTSDENSASTTISTSSTSTEEVQNTDISTSTDSNPIDQNKIATGSSDYNNQTVAVGVISPILGGTFKSGVVPIIVSFNKKVYVSGNPQLSLSTGNPQITKIDYKSGSGSGYLIFLYYIKKGNFSLLLDYTDSSALSLNGGSIKDTDGNDAVLTLPNPGLSGSLSDSSQISIKTGKN